MHLLLGSEQLVVPTLVISQVTLCYQRISAYATQHLHLTSVCF